MSVRHPEPGLEVLWQRHVPAGSPDDDMFVNAYADILYDLEYAVEELADRGRFEKADLVVTVSRRPLEGGT